MKFAYRQYQSAPSATVPSGILHRPEIPIRVTGSNGTLAIWALVDAWSDDSLLPLSIGQMIGANLDTTQTWKVEGIGGQTVSVVLGEVVLELSAANRTFRWLAKIGFVDFADPQDEVALVVHAGCLDYFRVTFDGHLRMLEVDVTPAFAGQVL